jgi:hypothetical protein
MGTLAERLGQPDEAGVFELPAARADTLQGAASANGFPCFRISLADADDSAAVMERFAVAMQFPSWFSPDWDSLAECLTDLSWAPAPGYVLLLEDSRDYQAAADEDFDTLIERLSHASASWSGLGVPFWAFILR